MFHLRFDNTSIPKSVFLNIDFSHPKLSHVESHHIGHMKRNGFHSGDILLQQDIRIVLSRVEGTK
jgi:hypothetical protein